MMSIYLTIGSFFIIRCNIPVIVMGETGCGKTLLIRYMCGLQAGPDGPRNMLLVKVSTELFNYEDQAMFLDFSLTQQNCADFGNRLIL